MQIVAFDKTVDKFYPLITENKVYEISGGYININDRKFNDLKSKTGKISSVFSNIGNAIKSAIPQLATSSKNGTISSFHFEPILYCEFYKVVDDDNEHLGRPLCKNVAPSTLPGYIQCLDVEVEIPCTKTENENIVSALESGFYYE